MPLSPGTRLGPYQIADAIGAGGMGEVYRARDERLHRTVAIKVLPANRLADPDRRARFLQEARTASALNHPHIVTLYDISSDNDVDFLVMEYVAGDPLNRLIHPGGMPHPDVLEYAAQMAGALAAAHASGVVHRDIKPANVVITPESQVKILDFGLAKLAYPPSHPESETLTFEAPLTGSRVIMGTSGYMSPEQARGERVDARTDLFALGAVIYEMATGRRAFAQPFDWTPPPVTESDPALGRLILKLLDPDPARRYQTAAEVAANLKRLQQVPAAAGLARRRWIWAAGGAAAAGALVWIGVDRRRQTGPQSGARLSDGARPSIIPEANEYYERATLFSGAGPRHDPLQVRKMFERALELDPKFASARAQYAFTHLILVLQGDSNDPGWLYKAEEDARQALRDDPGCGFAYSVIAGTHYLRGRKELIPAEVDRALKANWDDAALRMWIALYDWWNGDHQKALDELKRISARWPLFWPAHLNQGDILREQGDFAGAIRELDRITELDPQSRVALASLARVYMDTGDLVKARQNLERIRAQDRRNYRVRIHWAMLLALEGKKPEARGELDADVLAYGAIMAFGPLFLAECFALLGDTAKALEWLDRAARAGDDREDWLHRDPHFASLRQHPRFQQMLASISFRRAHRN